jgi:6-phosphogluconolactonase
MRYRTLLLLAGAATGMSSATAYGAQTFLYVANAGAQSISPYSVNSGALTPLAGFFFPVGDSLNSLAVDPAGRFAYGVSSDSNSVYAYTINPSTGALTAVSGSPFRTGSQPASVTVDPTGRFVYLANAGSNNISVYTIDSGTGALSEIAFSPFAAGTYPSSVTVDSTGQFLYVANLNSNNVSAFTIYPSTGSLTPVAGSPFPAGSLPASATTDPTGRFLYVANGSGSVSAYLINPATGALTAVSGSPFVAQSAPQSVTVDPTGRFVYVTNSASNNVSAYSIETTGGALTPITGSPFGAGTGPNAATIDPTGQYAYVTNATDGDIWVYTIDATTGALASGFPVPAQLTPDSVVTAVVNGPVLSISKSHVGSFTQGQTGVLYTVTLSNAGAGPSTGVVTITERVPAGLALVSMAGDGWTCPSGGVICTRTDPLAGGLSYPPVTVTMNVASTAPASVTNIVIVSGVGSLTELASDTAAIVELPVLTVSSSHIANFYQGEMGATYSIVVSNTGSASTSGMVTVTETVPDGLTLVSLSGSGWTCSGNATCTRSDPLAAGASYLAIIATVNVANNAAESVTNQVGVAGGGAPSANASDITIIPQPVLSITKSHTGNFTQGQSGATYSVTVSNGPSPPASQSSINASSTTVTIGSAACNDSQTVMLTSSGASVAFTVAVNYPNGIVHGNWLFATVNSNGTTSNGTTFSSSTGTSGVTLTVGLNIEIGSVSDTAQVIVTPTNPAGSPVTITVSYSPNSSCGGNAGSVNNGFIAITPGNISLTAATSGQQSQSVTILNISGGSTAFLYSVAPSNTWLSAQASSTTLAAGGTTTINITANASQTAGAGTYVGSLTIAPQSGFGGTTLNIPVTFAVTGGASSGGTLTINGSSNTTYIASISYVAPSLPGGECIPIQDTAAGANSYSSQVITASGGNWLLANNATNATTLQSLAPGTGACVSLTLSNIATTLTSGAYQGQVALTSSSGSTAAIYVNFYVSAGEAPGVTVTPSPIYVFTNVAANTSIVQQEAFTVSAASGYTMAAASLTGAADGFSISTPVVSNNTQTFTVTSNSTGLATGLYATTVTVTSTLNGQQNLTTITIALPVGQSGVTSGGPSTSTVAPSALAFQQQQGSFYWTSEKEAQAITITGTAGTQWSAGIVYANGSGWLTFDSASSGTLGNGPASLIVDLFNGVTNLAPSSTPYQATIDITTPSGITTVPVTLLVTPPNTPVLLGSPASTMFSATAGVNPANQTVSVVGSDNTQSTTSPTILAGTPTANWVTATTSGNTMTISVTLTGLSNGMYSATIPVSASAYPNAIDYPVTLAVSPASAGPLTLSATAVSFINVTSQISQILNVTAASPTQFTVAPSENTCTSVDWLQVVNANYTASSTNTPITITVNPAGIANGTTCAGTIQLISTSTQTVSVSMTVGAPGNGVIPTSGTVTVTENVPDGMTLVSMAGSGWTCPPNGNTCTRNDSLGAGASYPAIAVTVFGHSCGRQSCLQAAFQAAVSDTRRISQASLRDACEHEAGGISANCVSGLLDGGLKGPRPSAAAPRAPRIWWPRRTRKTSWRSATWTKTAPRRLTSGLRRRRSTKIIASCSTRKARTSTRSPSACRILCTPPWRWPAWSAASMYTWRSRSPPLPGKRACCMTRR